MFGNSKSFQTRKQTMENTCTPLEKLGTYQKIRLKNSAKKSGAYINIFSVDNDLHNDDRRLDKYFLVDSSRVYLRRVYCNMNN